MHETPLRRVAFRVPALVTGLPAIMGDGYIHRALLQTPSIGLPLLWRLLLSSVCCFAGWPDFSSSRYITGTHLVAIDVPFMSLFAFNYLRRSINPGRFDSGKPAAPDFKK